MNLTKKLLQIALLTGLTFNLSGCFHKTLEPSELTKAKEISIKGKNYTPEYDGLDPYLLTQEELVLGNQKYWYIHNEKLYLFVDEESKEKWFRDMDRMLEGATKYYESITTPAEEENLKI